MGVVIVVTSGKGGVGKTTAAFNLGAALSMQEKNVLLLDADLGLRNLDVVMGLEDRVVFDMVDVVEGLCLLKQAIVSDERFSERLHLLPAAQTRDKCGITQEQMQFLIDQVRPLYDYILIDCPAGIERGFVNAVSCADEAIVVTMPEVSAVRDADKVIGLLASYDLVSPKIIVNRIRPQMVKKGDMLSVGDVTELLGASLLGVVPDDEAIIRAGNLGRAAVLRPSDAGQAYLRIAMRILGESIPVKKAGHKRQWATMFRWGKREERVYAQKSKIVR